MWKAPKRAIRIQGRKFQVSAVILNILNNAADAVKGVKNPRLTIKVEKSETECLIYFGNNGPPISEENRRKIFLPFFTTKGKEGTGLGLKISKDLAAANQGRLFLNSTEETEFVLALKLASVEPG